LLAKQVQVTDIYELSGVERIKKFVFNTEQQLPDQQAQVHQRRFPESMQVADIEHLER
jgi:hypothetical protein